MFLMPGLIIACYATGVLDSVLSAEHKREMLRYLSNHQNEDGGWGLHTAGPSTMMGTSLKYAGCLISLQQYPLIYSTRTHRLTQLRLQAHEGSV